MKSLKTHGKNIHTLSGNGNKIFYQETWHLKKTDIASIKIAVSDGGAENTWGSYGWVIGDSNTIQMTHSGPACRQPMSSHRAESRYAISIDLFKQCNRILPPTSKHKNKNIL